MKKEKLTPMDSDAEVISALSLKVKKLEGELQRLRTENTKMELILRDNGLLDKTTEISDEEAICVEQIRKLREKSSKSDFTEQDARIFDVLHKNLKSARGEKSAQDKSTKTKKLSNQELLEMMRNEDVQ